MANVIARKIRHKRIRKQLSGTQERPRLVIFRSLKAIYAQLIDDKVGKTLFSSSSLKIKKKMKPIKKAEEVGKNIADVALKKGIKSIVFDRNGYKYHGKVKMLADSAREAGLIF